MEFIIEEFGFHSASPFLSAVLVTAPSSFGSVSTTEAIFPLT